MKNRSSICLLKAIVAAALSAVTISACEKTSAEETFDTTIQVAGGNVVKADAAASTLDLSVTVTGGHASEAVTAFCAEDWISVAGGAGAEDDGSGSRGTTAESQTRKVSLEIAENQSEGSRTATVVLGMEGAKDVKVTVIQSANPDYVVNNQLTFTLDVNDIKEATAMFTVAPSMSDTYYLYAFVTAAEYGKYSSGKAFVEATVAQIKEYAQGYEEKYGTPFSLKSRLYKGYISTTASGLTPDTDYCLVAFDLTLNWGYSGNVAVYKFKTDKVPPSSDAFTITYDENTGILMFTPAETTTGSFGIGITTAEYWDNAKAPSVVVDSYIESSSFSSYSVADGGRGFPLKYYSDMESGKEYVGFAFSYNTSTGVASNIAWYRFTYKAN